MEKFELKITFTGVVVLHEVAMSEGALLWLLLLLLL
jgi:hypothetical protein